MSILAMASAVGLAGIAVAATPAQAASEPWTVGTAQPAAASASAADSGRVVEMRLGLDCGKLSGKARTYAAERNLCPTGPSTNTVTEGNCGKAWLFVVDDVVGDRIGRINFGVTSILGTIVYHTFGVSWAYTPYGTGVLPETGVFPDIGPYFGSTYDISYTRRGLLGGVGAQLAGNVTLIWGAVCHVLPPYPTDMQGVT
jgi:hypothetical protein